MDAKSRYELVATFPDERRAEQAISALTSRGLPGDHVRLLREGERDAGERAGSLRAEMQEEAAEGVAGPALGFMTPSQMKGASAGVVLGGLAGLVLGLIVGAIWASAGESGISTAGRFAIPAIAFTVAGITVGFLSGGSVKPRADAASGPGDADRPQMSADRATLVAVDIVDDLEASMAEEVLQQAGAQRVDKVGPDGTPLPPQADTPRPADPPGRWDGSGSSSGG